MADCLADEACYPQLCAPRPPDGGAFDAGVVGVREYRRPRYDDIRDVSIGGWGAAPFNMPNVRLTAVALHPHCAGGLVVGGRSDFNGGAGLVARFDIVNAPVERRCAARP